MGFPDGLEGKVSTYNGGDTGWIPESGRLPGEGNGNPLQYSCLENPMDRGAWKATAHRVAKSWTWLKWLSMHKENENLYFQFLCFIFFHFTNFVLKEEV